MCEKIVSKDLSVEKFYSSLFWEIKKYIRVSSSADGLLMVNRTDEIGSWSKREKERIKEKRDIPNVIHSLPS